MDDLKKETEESVCKILVQTSKEYIGDLFEGPTLIQEILAHYVAEILYPGSFGTTYTLKPPYESMILKEQKTCAEDYRNVYPEWKELCEMSDKGDLIFHVPNSFSSSQEKASYTVLMPNYISEAVIGVIMSRTKIPGFVHVYGVEFDQKSRDKKTIYTLLERLDMIYAYITTEEVLNYMLLSIFYTLDQAQKKVKFVHGDSHMGNLLSRPIKRGTPPIQKIGDFVEFNKRFNFIPVLIDFGMSRLEFKIGDHEEVIVSPRLQTPPEVAHCQDFYFFNPYNDVLSLLGWFLMKDMNVRFPGVFYTDERVDNYRLYLITVVVDIELPEPIPPSIDTPISKVQKDFLTEFIHFFYEAVYAHPGGGKFLFWRPRMDRFLIKNNWEKFGIRGLYTPSEILRNFTLSLERIKGHAKALPGINSIQPLYPPFVFFKIFGQDEGQKNRGMRFENIVIQQFLNTDILNETFNPKVIPEFNRVIPYSTLNTCDPLTNQFFTLVEIQNRASSNLRFSIDCCRYDGKFFLQDPTISCGVVINAAYFNALQGYFPIGPIIIGDQTEIINPIPDLYKKYYGIVGLVERGKSVNIDRIDNFKNYSSAFVCGPILVYDGEILITPEIVREGIRMGEKEEFLYPLQCETPINAGLNAEEYCNLRYPYDFQYRAAEKQCARVFDVSDQYKRPSYVKNILQLKPGELAHTSNQNPRTAMAICEDKIYFIVFEGHDKRGSGVDLISLAKICKNLGAKRAINLDGGFNTRLAWKPPDENVIYLPNPSQLETHPVGVILSYIQTAQKRRVNPRI